MFHYSCSPRLSLAAALSLGIVYSLKALLMKYMPEFALQLKAAVWHKPVELLQQHYVYDLTLAGFLTGLVVVMAWAFIIVSLTSCIYGYLEHGKHGKK